MATKTFEELKQLAIQIRDEKTNKQNTATRVGTEMLEHLNKLEQDYYDKTTTDEELKKRDNKLTELDNKTDNLESQKLNKSDSPQKDTEEDGAFFTDELGNVFMQYLKDEGFDVAKISKSFLAKISSVISAVVDTEEDGAFLCNEKGEVFARFVNGKFESIGLSGGGSSNVENLEDIKNVVGGSTGQFLQKQSDGTWKGVSINNDSTEKLDIDITDIVPVVEGYTTELYNEQLIDVPNASNYYFKYTCTKGKQYERKWSIDAVSGEAGDYDLKIEVFNLKNVLVGSKTVTLRIIAKIDGLSENDVQVVAVGDSWHSPGIQTRTLVDDFSELYDGVYVCKSIGTQTNNNNSDGRNYTEGRSGWRSDQYVSQGWATQFIVTVSGVKVIPERKKRYRLTSQYSFFFGLEVEETNLSLSDDGTTYEGTILFNYYGIGGGQNYEINVIPIILTAYDGSDYGDSTGGMTGDTEIIGSKATVPSSTGNPFWNSEKGELDFNNYCKIHSLKPTIFYIALGTNISNDDVNIPTFITAMRNTPYDENVGVDWSDIPIIVAQQQHWGNIRWDVSKKQYIFNKHKLMTEAVSNLSDSKVYLMPFAQCFDSRYNFGAKEVNISPRNTAYIEKIPADYVHCTTDGYRRAGDLIFFFVMNVLYENLNN